LLGELLFAPGTIKGKCSTIFCPPYAYSAIRSEPTRHAVGEQAYAVCLLEFKAGDFVISVATGGIDFHRFTD